MTGLADDSNRYYFTFEKNKPTSFVEKRQTTPPFQTCEINTRELRLAPTHKFLNNKNLDFTPIAAAATT